MEHPCHRCGSPVKDNSPFCPECGAPQIQFNRPDDSPEGIVVPNAPSAPPPISLPQPDAPLDAHLETRRRVSDRERAVAFRSALKGGAIAAVFCLFPLGILIGMPLGGFLAALFYQRQSWRAEGSHASGFRLGALAGLFGFFLFGLIMALQLTNPATREELRGQMRERLKTLDARYTDPEQRKVVEYLMTNQGLNISMTFSFVMFCLVFVVLSGAGGALYAAIGRKRGQGP